MCVDGARALTGVRMKKERRTGFEPATPWVEARCSGQLSYLRMRRRRLPDDVEPDAGIEPATSPLPRVCSATEPIGRATGGIQTHGLPCRRGLLYSLSYGGLAPPPKGRTSSGRRGSNPRPPPWQGGALPAELLPRSVPDTQCHRPGLNRRPLDFQSSALPTELQWLGGEPAVGGAPAQWLLPAPFVGVTGFEPAPSSPRTTRATKLRHTPKPGTVPGVLQAEDEGFEPPPVSRDGFQDRCLRPLSQSSSALPATDSYRDLHAARAV